MTRIAPVVLPYNPKTLWFDARDLDLCAGDQVVVLTARGTEFGRLNGPVFEATPEQLEVLKSALKPVKRKATEEDAAHAQEMERLSREAMPLFRQMVAESEVSMRPVSVEYLFDGDKAVFNFEAEDRVDFRELVRMLAAELHVRIEMRQIGVRDEARMVGGIGHCGQQLCCARLGGEFCPVSIRMAKEQDLSLNSQKISGVCGRLMCCLRYEYDAYKEFKSRAPKQNAMVQTPDGPGKVVDLDMPREVISIRVTINEKPKVIKVPLADFEEPEEEGARPKAVGKEAWKRATEPEEAKLNFEANFLTSQFTGSDKLGAARAVRRNNANVKNATGSRSMDGAPASGRKRRSRSGRSAEAAAPQAAAAQAAVADRKQRRRRSTRISLEGALSEAVVEESLAAKHRKPMDYSKDQAEAKESATKDGSSRRRRRRKRGGSGAGAGAEASAAAATPGVRSSRVRSGQNADRKEGRPSRADRKTRAEGAGASVKPAGEARPRPERTERGASKGEGAPDRRRRRRRSSGRSGSAPEGQVTPNAD